MPELRGCSRLDDRVVKVLDLSPNGCKPARVRTSLQSRTRFGPSCQSPTCFHAFTISLWMPSAWSCAALRYFLCLPQVFAACSDACTLKFSILGRSSITGHLYNTTRFDFRPARGAGQCASSRPGRRTCCRLDISWTTGHPEE